jgi:hypothetical protein
VITVGSVREACDAPLRIEGIEAYKLILLLCSLSILFEEARDILIIVKVASHSKVCAPGKLIREPLTSDGAALVSSFERLALVHLR